MRKKIIYASISIFFIVTVIAPIISMLSRITKDGFNSVVSSEQFLSAVKNSISLTLIATILSLVLALLASFALERSKNRFKELFSVIFVLPMLIPSISHAFGLVSLFGTNGIITNLFGLPGGIYGPTGIIVGSIMYSFPVAFLMFSSILQYEDGLPYKAAEVLGISPVHRFLGITLPFLKNTIISAFFAVFTMIITDYGVPLMIGGKTITLSVLMYNKAVAMIDYDAGSVIGAFLLLPAIVAFIVDILNPESGQSSFVTDTVKPQKNKVRDTISYVFCILVSLFVIAPILAFLVMTFETKYPIDPTFTFDHITKTLNRGADEYLINSLIYSLITAVFGTFFAFVCSYMTARVKDGYSKVLHLASLTSMAIPGIVLGLSYVIFFSGTSIYGTILIVVLVNSIHFFSSPYLMMFNTLKKLNPNLESVGETLGISKIRIIKDVVLPKVKLTLSEMFTYFFVNSMMTISAISFLAPPAPKSVALMINQFEAQRLMESAAFVSLLILVVNVFMKAILFVLKHRKEKA